MTKKTLFKLTILSVGKDMEEPDFSHTSGKYENWYRHFGKFFGSIYYNMYIQLCTYAKDTTITLLLHPTQMSMNSRMNGLSAPPCSTGSHF